MTTRKVNSKWISDPAHSEILFKARHLMITNVNGEFKDFNIDVVTPGHNFRSASIEVNINAASISTNNEPRDSHLKSADFFEVDTYKKITFSGTSIKETEDGNYKLKGLLTIKGISKEVSLDVEFGGLMTDLRGNEKAGFTVTGKINRKDWGLNWNVTLDTGGVLVSDEIRITAEVQLQKQVQPS